MNFRELLFDFAFRGLKNKKKDSYIEKDIEIYYEYYGLKDNKAPTYQTVGDSHDLSRQRIEQKIRKNIKPFITTSEIEALSQIESTIASYPIITWNALYKTLKDSDTIIDDINLQGLVNLFKTFGINTNWKVYNFRLEKASKIDILNEDDFLIIGDKSLKHFKKKFSKIKTAPGIYGLVNLYDLTEEDDEELNELIEYILKKNPNSWTYEKDNKLWYMFENRDNVLINSLEKINSIVNSINVNITAKILYSAITGRTKKFERPNEEVLASYLKRSRYLSLNEDNIVFNDNINPPNISNSDKVIIDFFKETGKLESKYPALEKKFLLADFSKPNAGKNCYHSPFIFVDKSGGRTNYILNFIKKYESNALAPTDRYSIYKKKLIKFIEATDIDSVSAQRREQSILRDYLFGDKNFEKCAICGNKFSVNSLVTAHKKKRSICSESERIDPNIVWPLCKYGCDYLYEMGFIKVINSKLKTNKSNELSQHENNFLQSIEKNSINIIWLIGSCSYFE